MVEVVAVDIEHPHAQHCLREYFAELDRRFDIGFDPDATLPTDAAVVLVALRDGEPIGCGALKLPEGMPAEIKRLWVAKAARGLGVGRRLLSDLEARAAALGHGRVRLDTNGTLTEAIALYRSTGYREIPAFNDEPYAHLWFEKELSSS
jgi:ribosomal protein S18 acetylase RimI-like enzyme